MDKVFGLIGLILIVIIGFFLLSFAFFLCSWLLWFVLVVVEFAFKFLTLPLLVSYLIWSHLDKTNQDSRAAKFSISVALIIFFILSFPIGNWKDSIHTFLTADEEVALVENNPKTKVETTIAETSGENQQQINQTDTSTTEFSTSGYIDAIGNLYTGVILYMEDEGELVPVFKVLDRKKNVIENGVLIKNALLVEEIDSKEVYWKDVDYMIKVVAKKIGVKYYIKENDPSLP